MATVQAGGGVSFTGLLAIVFIVLKLTKVIAWSWWWVLSPLWLPISMFIVGFFAFMTIIFIGKGCIWIYEKITKKIL